MNNVWLYWENAALQRKPSYIELCHEIIKAKCKQAKVHLVTPENLSEYLPNLPPNLFNIRFKNTGKPSIALKTDYIRVALLQRYGGLWLDSDCIVLQDLGVSVLSLLQEYEFIAMRKSRQVNCVTNNFFASRPNSKIINIYLQKLEKLLQTKDEFTWLELGAELLTPIVNKYQKRVKFINESHIHPICYTEADIFFQKPIVVDTSKLVTAETLMIMLYNDLFSARLVHLGSFKNWPIPQILQTEFNIGELFRRAVKDIPQFAKYYLIQRKEKELEKLESQCQEITELQEFIYHQIAVVVEDVESIQQLTAFLSSIETHWGKEMPIYISLLKSAYELPSLGGMPSLEEIIIEKFSHFKKLFIYCTQEFTSLATRRNFLITKVNEPYFIICQTNFLITANTDLLNAWRIMQISEEVKVVGGMCYQESLDSPDGVDFFNNINLLMASKKNDQQLLFLPLEYFSSNKYFINEKTYYGFCDTVSSFALFNKAIFDENGIFEESFIQNQSVYHFAIKKNKNFKIAYSNALAVNIQNGNLPLTILFVKNQKLGEMIKPVFVKANIFDNIQQLRNYNTAIAEKLQMIDKSKTEIEKIVSSFLWKLIVKLRGVKKILKMRKNNV